MNKKIYITLLILFNSIYYSFSQCIGSILTNGSFTSIEGENVTSPGWSGAGTPDINDENGPLNCTPSFIWTGTPLASADGGTWQNIFGSESVEQTVSLTQGQTYTICFEYAAQGIELPGQYLFVGPVGVRVYLDGLIAFITPDDTTQYTWETSCYTFVANQQNVAIKFGTTQSMYVAIDGACLFPGTTAISENLSLQADINISPNPFLNKLNISLNNNESSEIILYDLASREVLRQNFHNSITINTERFEKGICFYELRNKNGVIKKGKVMKN